ncbi:MAG: hypothetical protein JNM94_08805 [Phycisphaerae bacterium]|nr:hypothetical protein [Phycisphaerae bacterium]
MNAALISSALLQGFGFLFAGPVGVVILTLGLLGRRRLTRGRCAACRADLSRERLLARDRCPGCNAELAEPSAIVAVRTGAGWKRIAGGAALLVVAVASVLGGNQLRMRGMVTAFGSMSTMAPLPALVHAAYTSGSPFTFQGDEVARRMGQGRVTAAELRAELLTLLASKLPPTVGADRLFALSMADGVVDPAIANAFAASTALTPTLDLSSLSEQPPKVSIRKPSRQRLPDDPVDVVHLVREVRADGVPLAGFVPFGMPDWQDNPIVLPEGTTRVEVDIDVVFMSSFDAQRVRDSSGLMRPPSSWPKPLATSRITLPTTATPP